jgi:myo-inositol catabolism protein IolC
MLAGCMGQIIQLQELHQARRRRSEKVSMDHCVELLEWNLKKSIDNYFGAPREERSMRATQIRKLSEILESALRLL